MKYILLPGENMIMFGRYQDYILPLRDQIPESFRDLATESRYYDLNSSETLHDARISKIIVSETAGDQENEVESAVSLRIELCGGYRQIFLEYENVTRYQIIGPNYNPGDMIYFDAYHGDLFTHEFRIAKEKEFIHELAFVTDASIVIHFESMRHWSEDYA